MTPRRLLGALWFLSWFELYLEIFRHHHVTSALFLHPTSWIFPSGPGAHPGAWLRAVLACSTLAPIAFGIAALWRANTATRDQRSPLPFAAIVFGCMLAGLASINQILRHDQWTVDLTLRQGNGGFIVVGAVLAAFGAVVSARPTR